MTELASKVLREMTINWMVTAEDLLAMDIGNSQAEVEFIMEQIKIVISH